MNTNKKLIPAAVASALLPLPLLAIPGLSLAQQGSGFQLEEVVVTAQRKEEGLQRAAIAIDVATGNEIREAGITDMSRLGELSPALSVQSTANGNLVFIRGVGNFTLTPNSDSASAFNYDGVYLARPTSSTGVFYDLERVEILKGPQGTLYGRNATGGAINVIPVHPQLDDSVSGYVTGSYGGIDDVDSNSYTMEGAINIPLGAETAARISASSVNSDPLFEDGTGDEDTKAVRFQLLTDISDNLSIRFSGDYAASDDTGAGITYVGRTELNRSGGPNPFTPANIPMSDGIYTAESQAFRQGSFVLPAATLLGPMEPDQYRDNEYYGAHAQLDYVTDLGTLTVIPAWRKAELDYLSPAGAFPYQQRETDEQTSLEVRFAGTSGMFDYILGGYYFDETVDISTQLSLGSIASFLENEYTTESYAPFARLTANITEQFRLVGAVRYSTDEKTSNGVSTGGTIVCTTLSLGLPCFGAPLFPLAPTPEDLPFPFPTEGGPPTFVGGNAIAIRSDFYSDDSLKDSRTTFRLAAEYDLAPDSMIYASVETGYRSGGFNPAAGFETFDPEYITAYTLGSKNRLIDQRLELNLEAFYWDYTDQQVSHVGLDANGSTANITENIGESRIMGLEVQSRFLLTENTLLSADVHYLDAENTDFVYETPDNGGGIRPVTGCDTTLNDSATLWSVDCSGFQSFNSPEWTINLAAQQTFSVSDDLDLIFGIDTQYKSDRYLAFQYLDEEQADSVWRTNAQVTLASAPGTWSVSAYLRNIEDERTPTYMNSAPSSNLLISGTTLPRNWGLRFDYNF